MSSRRLIAVPLMIATYMTGCPSRDSSRDSERDRNEQAFTVHSSTDWGDAAGRVVNHLLGTAPPRGGIWPAQEDH
jgi:hypothetical protein